MPEELEKSKNCSSIEIVSAILRETFGDRFQTGKSVREQHAHSTTIIAAELPDAVVFPKSAEEVAEVVKTCAEHRVPVIPFGTGTSLEGHVNAPNGGISLSFREMNRLIAVNGQDLDCIVEPGITRKELNEQLRDTGLFFPIDPGADASIGGMAATRASGTNAVRYGTMRDNVLALKAVMSDGRIISTGTRERKSSAGYDLTRLLIGSEGTLGVITELTLRLHGVPEAISAASCSFGSVHDACLAVIEAIQFGIPLARVELLDELTVSAINGYSGLDLPETPLLLLEFHGTEASVAEQATEFQQICNDLGGQGFEWTVNAEERNRLWQGRHDAYWASLQLRKGARAVATDACVPISRLADCVRAAQEKASSLGLLAPIVGHVGDGNFHMSVLIDADAPSEIERCNELVSWLADCAISMGGTCTGEHGIGQGKMTYLSRELGFATEWMATIKTALDPRNILNPGKIVSID